jgi:glycosyltransferase involved in cell wall biosynthesis
MGWTLPLVRKCGSPPPWAECHAPQSLTAGDFLGRCHALLGLNGGARENWPRVGLEAMACGVPLVCQNLWGWREMIVDGETGFLTDSDDEMAFRLAQLAYDEPLRQKILLAARAHVERLAEPTRLAGQWRALFEILAQHR